MPIYSYTLTDGSKRYRVVYRKPDHKQQSKYGFKRKADAVAFEASVVVDKATGKFIPVERGRITIGQLGPDWLAGKKYLKISAYKPLESSWRTHVEPVWGDVRLMDLEHSAIQSWVSELASRRSPTVVLRAFGVLHGIITTAVLDKRLSADPAARVSLPKKIRRKHVYLTHEQVGALAAAGGEHTLLLLVLAYCGLRWGEAIALRPSDVDFDRGRIQVTRNAVEVGANIYVGSPKTYENRSVPVPAAILQAIQRRAEGLDDEALLFPNRWGHFLRRPGTSAKDRSWYKTALAKAGLPSMTIHDLRHTAASLAISAGANVKAVQRMLGHSSAAVTLDVYADLFDDDLDAVSDAMNAAIISANVVPSVVASLSAGNDEGPAPQ
ncbi:tyrosine-type recombinase/integrase [Pseudoclavibacter sp. CFCC 13611]|uniref:tyrosine-type recombinase/integrase n=1 Tax=Pseudoclavibacter sp. CFCC 13611 TaxID=2615178 RepID=UPI001300FF86|nr:site-specific integrase [Pseudoclavibacter sp. CFCC 13611]KAB1662832.1 site-specific integrase [Pseudoclavibacter sp. CFCC 13611]